MKHAFSLVELSIVLVILGLLTGGILTGQNLIRAVELRSVTTEFQVYQTAINTFRNKYFSLPGDMTNATDFWGDNATHCADAAVADGTPGTCNGDGNGILDGTGALADGTYEWSQAWNQLALAGLIEGSYTGVMAGDWTIGEEAPKSRISSLTWWFRGAPATYGVALLETNMLTVSSLRSGYSPIVAGGGGLTSEEAWNIDTKMDDVLADSGRVLGVRDSSASVRDVANACVTNKWDQPTSAYVLTDTDTNCRLMFVLR